MLNMAQVAASNYNDHLMQKMGWQFVNLPLETANAFANWYLAYASYYPESVEGMRELLEMVPGRIRCMSEIPRGKGPIVICGSGSSLDKIAPTLNNWKGAVMCSTSQASTLVHYGRTPDYVACLDPRAAKQDELAAPSWGDAVLIGHVSIPATYIMQWLRRASGKIYLGRIMEPNYDWYAHHLGKGYPQIRHIIMPMIDSVAAMIGFATWMGYGPILMAGVDYWGPRFDRYEYSEESKSWTLDAETSKYDAAKNTKDLFSGMNAFKAMNYSSRGSMLSAFLNMKNDKYNQRIFQLSDTTMLAQFPYVEWNDGSPEIPMVYENAKVCEDLEIALSVWGTFLVPLCTGWGQDYHTYIAEQEDPFFMAMKKHNDEISVNLSDFARIEKEQGMPMNDLIASGRVTVESGELLIHETEEFGTWDWHKIKPIDIPAVLMRRRWLLEEAAKRGYSKEGKVK